VRPELRRFGNSQSPVVVIDDFSGAPEDVARLADALAPFPLIAGNHYPGVRRAITEADAEANAHVLETCRRAAPFIGGAFDVQDFELVEASFSLVTLHPAELQPGQRAPHFDTPDPMQFALLHHLRVPPGSGTARYTHRATGIERVEAQNLARFVPAAQAGAAMLSKDSGYMHGSDAFYEQIGAVEAVPDRVIIYHSNLLHSGIIPRDMSFSADPCEGRLTANLFLRGR